MPWGGGRVVGLLLRRGQARSAGGGWRVPPRPPACKATKASAHRRWPLCFQRLTESSASERQPAAAEFVTTSVTTALGVLEHGREQSLRGSSPRPSQPLTSLSARSQPAFGLRIGHKEPPGWEPGGWCLLRAKLTLPTDPSPLGCRSTWLFEVTPGASKTRSS